MSSTLLPNFLRSARKRLALSQGEVAFLLGARGSSKISSYEGFTRVPNLETALALELIYGKPVGELFSGVKQQLAHDIENRAKILRHRVSFRGSSPQAAKRRATVSALISSEQPIETNP